MKIELSWDEFDLLIDCVLGDQDHHTGVEEYWEENGEKTLLLAKLYRLAEKESES